MQHIHFQINFLYVTLIFKQITYYEISEFKSEILKCKLIYLK